MKASARAILMDIPDYARGDQELWTPERVKKAMLDAFRMLRRVGGRVGPAGDQAYWPEFQNNPNDYADEERQRRKAEQRQEYETRMNATRMDMVLLGWRDADGVDHAAWLLGPLMATPDYREKLAVWIKAELRGEALADLCYRKGWVRSTFVRHVTRAAAMIADRLNRAGVEVW